MEKKYCRVNVQITIKGKIPVILIFFIVVNHFKFTEINCFSDVFIIVKSIQSQLRSKG